MQFLPQYMTKVKKPNKGGQASHELQTSALIEAFWLLQIHYNKFDFFQGSKPLKKVLKNLEKNY